MHLGVIQILNTSALLHYDDVLPNYSVTNHLQPFIALNILI